MATAALALERIQAGLEATRGTAVAATRRVYGERGGAWWEPTVSKEFLKESMTSLIDSYRHLITEVAGKFTIPFYVTPADLAWWLQLFAKGGVTGVLSNTSVYTYTFLPTAGSDDLKTATFEAFSDTQGYQFPFSLGEKLELSWTRGQSVRATAELYCQQAIAQAVTGAIGDRTGLNPLAGTTAKVFIDNGGGTFGTTAYANVLNGKVTLTNGWETVIHNQGNLFYDDAVRDSRSIDAEIEIHFKDTAEYAHLLDDAERLVRVQFLGPTIPASSPTTAETVWLDLAGYYTAGAFGTGKAIRTVKLSAHTQYDSSLTADWKLSVLNALPTLP